MKDITRRTLLGIFPLVATACATGRLQTNTAGDFKEGDIKVAEDLIRMQKTGLFENFYFAIPLNTEEKILNYGEPSFALIPESKSRISIKQVGQKGGEVIVDAPKGDIYFPYALIAEGDGNSRLETDFSKIKPARFITNFKINDLKTPEQTQKKISLEKMTEKDIPFSDETLKALNNQEYVINRAEDIRDEQKVLPIYFTKTPLTVEYNRAESDGNIRILGETYLFSKEKTREKYFESRGFTNPIKTKTEGIKKTESVKTDSKQN